MSPAAESHRSRRGRRARRYREIVGVLWEERIFPLLRAAGVDHDAPTPFFSETGAEGELQRRAAAGPQAGRHAPYEVRIRRALERLGPTFIKLGQILSARGDLIDPALAAELLKLQDQVPTVPWKEMEQTLREELGEPPEALYAEFDLQPMAAASLGQVHRARLHDGRAVVVKIQRPGVRDVMETDLDILATQAQFLAAHSQWGRKYNVASIVDELVRELRGELDYLHEARNLARFRAAFTDSPDLFFPAPIWDLTTTRVLTMELVEGIPGSHVQELHAAGIDTAGMVRSAVECYFRQIFDLGSYHADPHSGNLFAMPNDRVGFIDFGRVASISRPHREAVLEMLLAVVDDDPVDMTEALLSMCTADPSVDVGLLQADLAEVVSLYRQSEERPDVLRLTLQAMLATVRKHRLDVPGEIVVLLTTLSVLEGVARQIEPGFALIEAAKPYAQRWLMRSLGARTSRGEVVRALRRYRKLLNELPVALTRALRRASQGEFRVAIRPDSYDDAMQTLKEMVNRLAFSVLVAAFVLAFGYISAQRTLANWVRWSAGVVLGLSALLALWLLASIVFATWRRRRPRLRRRQ